MLIVAGRRTNHFGEALSVSASTASARLPVGNLGNGDPRLPAAAADDASPWDIVLDGRIAQITDPHFDAPWFSAPSGWSKGGPGSLARDTAVKDGGTASMRFDTSSGDVYAVRPYQVACGAQHEMRVSVRRESLVFGVKVYLYCEDTGLFWTVNGWEALESPWGDGSTISADTWGTLATTITAPNLTDTDVVSLRLILRGRRNTDATAAKQWADNVRVTPKLDFLSLHHARGVQGATITLATSADATTWTAVATMAGSTARAEAWLRLAAPVAALWWRVRIELPALSLGGVPTSFLEPPSIGEAVLALARKIAGTWRTAEDHYEVPQVRVGQGGHYRQAQAGGPRRRVTLARMGASTEAWAQALNRLYLASLGGVRDSVIVWDESAPSRVVLGAIDTDLALPFDVVASHVPHTLRVQGYAPAIWSA